MILDTDFVIDIMRKEESSVKKLKELIDRREPQIITSPTLFELYSGVGQSQMPETEKKKILHTISNLLIWTLDAEGAEKGGEIDGRLVSEGERIDPVDSMIAGIALSHGQKILTKNARHFSRVPGLGIETY